MMRRLLAMFDFTVAATLFLIAITHLPYTERFFT